MKSRPAFKIKKNRVLYNVSTKNKKKNSRMVKSVLEIIITSTRSKTTTTTIGTIHRIK